MFLNLNDCLLLLDTKKVQHLQGKQNKLTTMCLPDKYLKDYNKKIL